MNRWKWSLTVASLAVMVLLASMASMAQEQPDPQALLQQLKALQQQNQMLQQQLQQLQAQVSTLAQTQQEQGQTIEKIPEEAAKKAAEGIKIKLGGKETLTFKGFLSATIFAQDADFAFGNGQSAEFPKQEFENDNDWFMGGDVRNTRLTAAFSGTRLANWDAGALLEADFFGGYNGSGAFSQQQPHLRMRLGYIELKKDGTKIRIGQDWTPLFGEWPISTSHIAFPLGYGSAGFVGWRFPGIYLWKDLGGDAVKTQLQAGVFEGSWNGPGAPTSWLSAGNVGFQPQVEARLNFTAKDWKMYLVGHWDQKDLKGVNEVVPDPAINNNITGSAIELGGKVTPGNWLIHGNLYWGQGIGQQFGAITQFGDIESFGGWLQVGYKLTDNWGLYGFYGLEDPDNTDVLLWIGEGGRMENRMYNLHLRYTYGPYWFGIEWTHDQLKVGSDENAIDGNQLAFSALYKF